MSAPTPSQGEFISKHGETPSPVDTGLSADAQRRIRELMRQNDVSFNEAALQLGLMHSDGSFTDPQSPTAEQAEKDEPGFVEVAIRRTSGRRDVVVRQGSEVIAGPSLQFALDQQNPRNEKMRVLRTQLLLINESTRAANVVALLSSDAGEGRSQLAAELAISFAQLGRRTLLIDADLRKPKLHSLFGSDNEYGLSWGIAGNSRPHLHPVRGLNSMFLCTAGQAPTNPLELLSDGRFGRLLTEWRSAYEFIVIDTPPAGHYADAMAVATVAGRVLIVSRTQHSSYKGTQEMMRRLASTQAKVLGAVMSDF